VVARCGGAPIAAFPDGAAVAASGAGASVPVRAGVARAGASDGDASCAATSRVGRHHEVDGRPSTPYTMIFMSATPPTVHSQRTRRDQFRQGGDRKLRPRSYWLSCHTGRRVSRAERSPTVPASEQGRMWRLRSWVERLDQSSGFVAIRPNCYFDQGALRIRWASRSDVRQQPMSANKRSARTTRPRHVLDQCADAFPINVPRRSRSTTRSRSMCRDVLDQCESLLATLSALI
jgi:hypothetical protein